MAAMGLRWVISFWHGVGVVCVRCTQMPQKHLYTLGGFLALCGSQHSNTTFTALPHRCRDLPVAHRSKRRFCVPLLVIPGPVEPESVDVYFERTYKAFQDYGPDSAAGLRVSQADNTTIDHTIFLVSLHAGV